jgi:hypothetical protein
MARTTFFVISLSPFDASDVALVEIGNPAPLKLQSVVLETFERDRHPGVLIGLGCLLAVGAQGPFVLRISEIRGKSFRLEVHAGRHMRHPRVHRAAEDACLHTLRLQMRGEGQAVGPCTNDDDV